MTPGKSAEGERVAEGARSRFVIHSNHKWFRNLAISAIVADTLEHMDLKLPPTQVDLADIRGKYHAAVAEQKRQDDESPSKK